MNAALSRTRPAFAERIAATNSASPNAVDTSWRYTLIVGASIQPDSLVTGRLAIATRTSASPAMARLAPFATSRQSSLPCGQDRSERIHASRRQVLAPRSSRKANGVYQGATCQLPMIAVAAIYDAMPAVESVQAVN